MKISVIIITLNEENNIGRCLNSIRDIADEIVVVDSLSTDNTEKICSEYDVRFVKQKWLGFSDQKNFANSLSSNDWIFSIDADEVVSPKLKDSILKLKEDNITDNQVFTLNRLTNYCGKWIYHCGWYPDRKIRIWNKKSGQWDGTIHETIKFSQDISLHNLDGNLLHYSYKNIADHVAIANKYTTLVAAEYKKKGKKYNFVKLVFSPFYAFFRDYFFRGGFLDGKAGYTICKINAFSTYLKYIKLWELHNEEK